jgi:glycosyltransferase involved in cell wall biosynthesis
MEIVVVDDGSTDESAVEVLRQLGPDPERAESLWKHHVHSATGALGFGFWTHDVSLQYIHQPNRGMGAARNRGLHASHGEFVAFIEPDYRWDPKHLERQVDFFKQNKDAWIAQGRVVSGRTTARCSKKKKPTASAMSFEQIVGGNGLCASALVARRRCFEIHGGFDENLPACEDYDLWVRIAAHAPIYQVADSVVCIKKPRSSPSWSLDRYRVYALEKAYQSGRLNSEQRQRVADELVARCDVLVEGFRKLNNTERANFYDRKRKKFEIEVAKLEMSDAAGRADAEEDFVTLETEEDALPSAAEI